MGTKIKNLPIRKQDMEIGSVQIGNNVWMGRGVMVLKDSIIGNNSIVGTGSVVTKKFDDNQIIAGVPAKVLKNIYE